MHMEDQAARGSATSRWRYTKCTTAVRLGDTIMLPSVSEPREPGMLHTVRSFSCFTVTGLVEFCPNMAPNKIGLGGVYGTGE